MAQHCLRLVASAESRRPPDNLASFLRSPFVPRSLPSQDTGGWTQEAIG